jgi:hypothetical protein
MAEDQKKKRKRNKKPAGPGLIAPSYSAGALAAPRGARQPSPPRSLSND